MKLPNAKQAVVEERKLREYLLSNAHAIGRFKANFFASLGFTSENWTELASALRRMAEDGEAQLAEGTEYGQKYLVFGTIVGKEGSSSDVVTVWVVLKGHDNPRLVTVYPG